MRAVRQLPWSAPSQLPAKFSRTTSTRRASELRYHRRLFSPTVFPGDESPYSGLRHPPELPEELQEDTQSQDIMEKELHAFAFKTSREMYEQFPELVRASSPLLLDKPGEPAGSAALRVADGGPLTAGKAALAAERMRSNQVESCCRSQNKATGSGSNIMAQAAPAP